MAVVMFLTFSFILICGCFWTNYCMRRHRIARQNQSILTTPRFYLTQGLNQQQAASNTHIVVNSTARPSIPQPDLSNRSLQKAPPPLYEAAKNFSPSPPFESSSTQPSTPQIFDLPPEDPSINNPADI